VDRREFVVAVGADLLLPIYAWRLNPGPWAAHQDLGQQVSHALVDEIERLITVRRKMDDEHGGGILLDMLHSDLRFVTDLLKSGSYRDNIGRRLYSAAAEIARLAGWSAFDSGKHAAAQQYYMAALRATTAMGDRALAVNIVGFMGIQAYSTRRYSDATRLMDVATTEAAGKTPAVVQSMAWARAGRAYAKLGDSDATRSALNKSDLLLSRAVNGDSPSWAYWVDDTRIMAQVGRALFDLGDYPVAIRELLSAIESCGESYPRDRATWLGRIAIAQLRAGDLEAGCDSCRQAVDLLAHQVETERGLGFIRMFQRELSAHTATPTARDFLDHAATQLDP
jgi:tetratricopeptide (TPR) repeat protein